MTDLMTLQRYRLFGDFEREIHLARAQEWRNQNAALCIGHTAATLQGAVNLNTAKGVLPYARSAAQRGMATVAQPLAGATVYTAVPVPPAPPAKPRRRQGRARR